MKIYRCRSDNFFHIFVDYPTNFFNIIMCIYHTIIMESFIHILYRNSKLGRYSLFLDFSLYRSSAMRRVICVMKAENTIGLVGGIAFHVSR